ncbi:MAG: helix-turn-helix domain-containing protein, partial [Oscillospiraceae bacterium]|nr:helix-turn-helix domain-containing protein [Oscillospiraceae bacterium]
MRNRFREAREERRFSAVALAEKLGIHPSTLTNWEAGRRQITPDKLVELADILGFTIDYLLARESPQVSLIEPVDKKALRAMHGQPVWAAAHGWMLVNIVENAFVLKNLRLIPFDEVQEPIYFIPPALSLSMRGVGEPLRLDDVLSGDRFWVEPITADNDLAAELRGWYSIYEKRLAQNEFGNRFYIDTYGAKWLAFRDCIKEKENWERLSVMDKNIYDTIETMVSIGKGWSEDKKYCITTADGIKYLLRISPLSQYETKKILFSTTEQIAAMGIPMCVPIEFGICDDGVYTIQSWIDGEDLKPVLSTLSETEQYALGIQAGKILKKIHSILVPEEQDGWAVKYNLEIDAKIKAYRDCSLHFDGDDYVLAYIEHNRHLLKNRPQCYLVWDYNI